MQYKSFMPRSDAFFVGKYKLQLQILSVPTWSTHVQFLFHNWLTLWCVIWQYCKPSVYCIVVNRMLFVVLTMLLPYHGIHCNGLRCFRL